MAPSSCPTVNAFVSESGRRTPSVAASISVDRRLDEQTRVRFRAGARNARWLRPVSERVDIDGTAIRCRPRYGRSPGVDRATGERLAPGAARFSSVCDRRARVRQRRRAAPTQLLWVDRAGLTSRGLDRAPGLPRHCSSRRTGRGWRNRASRLAQAPDIWVLDQRHTTSRLTSDGFADAGPVVTHGTEIVFRSNRSSSSLRGLPDDRIRGGADVFEQEQQRLTHAGPSTPMSSRPTGLRSEVCQNSITRHD